MRLHHLRATAFGPFAGTVEVDFDALSDAGLFLLTGATGAGKSSVLDAVCFALYGEVPGDRHDAKHLRSDHAPADASPEVRLELSVGERRFLFTRSPAWERPKRRGTGTTRQQARVVVEEKREGSWITLTTRLDDAGLLVTDLLGMTCTQFTQVAMLPQGRFQAFLRASSAERHAVLQRLFRTDRFERIERWLSERRREVRQREHRQHDRVVTLAHRFSETAELPLPAAWAEADRSGHDHVVLSGWMAEALGSARAAVTTSAKVATQAHEVQQRAAAEHERAAELARLQAAGRRAEQVITELDETADEHVARQDAVAAHHRAAAVSDRIERAAMARAEVERLGVEVASALDFPGAPKPTAGAVSAALDEAIRAEQQAQADLRLEDDHRRAAAEVDRVTDALAAASAVSEECEARLATLETEMTTRTADVTACEEVAARLGALRIAEETAAAGRLAATELIETTVVVNRLETELRDCVDEALRLREAHLDARAERIEAMAGELAGELASGCACPVCGSIEHPAPAGGSSDIGRQREEATLRAWETAEATRLAAEQALLGARARHYRAAEGARGRTLDEWTTELATARARLGQATDAAERLPTARRELEKLRAARDEQVRRLAGHRADHDQLTTGLADAQERLTRSATARDAARGDFPDLAQRAEHHRRRVTSLDRARTAVTALSLAQSVLGEAESAADRALADAGFSSADAVRAALLDAEDLVTVEKQVAARDDARREAELVLRSPDVLDALEQEAADLAAATSALEEAETARGSAEAALIAARTAAVRLAGLAAETDAEIADWRPLLEEFVVVEAVSTLAEGTSRDNLLKMRLSAYVLGERLRQVVAAANDRLAAMTDQRYALEHTEERGVGAQKGGLSLRVRDDWTGVRRDPATLSGGETFVVSLALALGLADTVAHEAGGVPIETMFIDEGFGSLDAETLDDVMDTLDSLRNNGRVVGVVSHVAEMRERIPVGIEVHKGRRGSVLMSR